MVNRIILIENSWVIKMCWFSYSLKELLFNESEISSVKMIQLF